MTSYRVTWTIDVDAENATAAAREALEIQRDPNSIATVFEVKSPAGHRARVIDLTDKPNPPVT